MASEDGATSLAGALRVVVLRTTGGFLVARVLVDAFVDALGAAFLGAAFPDLPFLRAGASGLDHCPIHSSITRQVLPRAARPVSIPRCPPGTISKRTSRDPLSSGSIGRTAATGAMPSV